MKFLKAVLPMAALTIAQATNAATLQVSGGLLTGATGVQVTVGTTTTSYDVQFVEGSFNSLYPTGAFQALITGPQSLTGPQIAAMGAAATPFSQALMDEVFIGLYDSQPYNVYGCVGTALCNVVTPYAYSTLGTVYSTVAKNSASETFDSVDLIADANLNFNSATAAGAVWASWSQSSEVPVPAAAWLFASGLLGLAGMARRQAGA